MVDQRILTEFYVAIRNNGEKTAEQAEVRLLDIDDGTKIGTYSKRLQSDDEGELQIALHPVSTAYFKLIEVAQSFENRDELVGVTAGPFAPNTINKLGRGPYWIKVRVNGADVPTQHQFYKFEVNQWGGITFEFGDPLHGRMARI